MGSLYYGSEIFTFVNNEGRARSDLGKMEQSRQRLVISYCVYAVRLKTNLNFNLRTILTRNHPLSLKPKFYHFVQIKMAASFSYEDLNSSKSQIIVQLHQAFLKPQSWIKAKVVGYLNFKFETVQGNFSDDKTPFTFTLFRNYWTTYFVKAQHGQELH